MTRWGRRRGRLPCCHGWCHGGPVPSRYLRAAANRLARGRLAPTWLLDCLDDAIARRTAQGHPLGDYPSERIRAATERHATLRPLTRLRTSIDRVAAVHDHEHLRTRAGCHMHWPLNGPYGPLATCGYCGGTLGRYNPTPPEPVTTLIRRLHGDTTREPFTPGPAAPRAD